MCRTVEDLTVVVSASGDTHRIDVRGELDLASREVLREALDGVLETGRGDVDVELSGMTFCDSTGLCVLLTAHRELRAAGRRLRLVNPAPAILRLLDLSATRSTFEVHSDPLAASSTGNDVGI
jgi:anti-sigma B factor antagonist